ncbi:MAG: cytoplasmic protein [Lentisphaerae bacterium GWF2_44_16]|nr:MAG: cytoplasmic protein [Lentisphaerae bacterium GWF2_44_16]
MRTETMKKQKNLTFTSLVQSIRDINEKLSIQTSRAINIGLTLRNWFIGYHIAEYELKGADRAKYGDKLLDKLSHELGGLKISNCNRRQLYRYLKFYRFYPKIVGTLSPQFETFIPESTEAHKKVGTASPQSNSEHDNLLQLLSYSHIEQLVDIDDETKRTFYEIECIRGNWSVRDLERQINSLYYERSGLSTDKKKLAKSLKRETVKTRPELTIRDPYIFEFLGLKPAEVMSETHLEDQLLDKLQSFLLELGNGFCFEARQKRILIGDTHNFVDLVFYHRILKCHVLIELKLAKFSHENVGQLNTYVSWYKKNMMAKGDNPPIGILLCTRKDCAVVEYALAGMDNKLFVSRYQLELPKKEEMQRFIEEQMKKSRENER